ncbi:MAG: hypothetical protein REV35_01205 [Burkholderia sp.]|nr:hypothetical protein [Burkholderia sp.]
MERFQKAYRLSDIIWTNPRRNMDIEVHINRFDGYLSSLSIMPMICGAPFRLNIKSLHAGIIDVRVLSR